MCFCLCSMVKFKLELTLSRADAADEQTITVFEDYQFYPAGTRQDFTDDHQYETWITPIFTSSEDYLTFTLWTNLEMTLYYGTTTRTVNIPHYNHWWWSSDDNRWERSTTDPDSKADAGLFYYAFFDGHYGIEFDGNANLGIQYDIEVTNDYTVE